MRLAIFLILSCNAIAQWQPLETHTTESLRGLSVFNASIVWASGTHGTYLFTTNGGTTWTTGKVPGAESLDFRDVESFGSGVYLLAAGLGDKSRIYHTRHLGEQWELQFTNPEPSGFLDCMGFFDERHGIVVGDPVKGKFQILRTDNGGATWQYSDPRKMPPAMEGEGAFAASGTCITTQGKKNAWFATGGVVARVFRSTDGGKSWKVSETPIMHGSPSAGIFSIRFQDAQHGVIVGGDYLHPDQGGANIATSDDGGKTWKLASAPGQKYFSAVTYVTSDSHVQWLVAVGSAASAFSKDALTTWEFFSTKGFNAVASKLGVAYAAGANGSIARADLTSSSKAGPTNAHCPTAESARNSLCPALDAGARCLH